MPHVDHNGRKSHMKLQLRVTLRLTSKTVDYFDVGDVEDALRDYLSKFEWGGGHMSTLRGVGWQ